MRFFLQTLTVLCLTGLLSIAVNTELRAQNSPDLIKGIVVDSATFEPLPYVTIQVKNTFRGTTADEKGNFSIAATPNDTLVIALLGYQKLELPLYGYEPSVIRLAERATMLRPITIDEYRLNTYEGLFDDQNDARLKQSIPFYYSKARKDKIRAGRWREESLHVKTYVDVVVNNPNTKKTLMQRFSLTEEQYYAILTRFNEENYQIMYYLTASELTSFLYRFFEREAAKH